MEVFAPMVVGLVSALVPMLFFGTFLIIGVGGVVMALTHQQSRMRTLREHWKKVGDRRGLVFRKKTWKEWPSLRGPVGKHEVLVDMFQTGGKHKTTWTRVRVRPPVALPAGAIVGREGVEATLAKMVGGQDIEVGIPKLDYRLRLRGRTPEDLRSWMAQPAAMELAHAVDTAHDGVREGWVTLVVKESLTIGLDELIDRTVLLADDLTAARVQPWAALRDLPGLELVEQGQLYRISGQLDGVPIEVLGDPRRGRTRITAQLPPGLPPDLHLEKGSCELGDPILDRMVTATGAPLAVLQDLVAQDGVREDLLAVVHGNPGSTVDAQRIVVDVRSFSDAALVEKVWDAVRLANSLRERLARGQASQGNRRPGGVTAKP